MTIGYISKGFSDNYSQDARKAVGGEWINYYNQLSEQYYLVSRLSYSLAAGIYGYNIYHSISFSLKG